MSRKSDFKNLTTISSVQLDAEFTQIVNDNFFNLIDIKEMLSKSSILVSSEVMAIKADYEKHGFEAEFETNFEHAYKQVVVANPNKKRTEAIFEIATILLGLLEGLFPKAAKAIGLFGRIGLLIGRVFGKG